MFGYRYIRPLTAPNGNEYTKETEQDMLDAIEAGDVILAPFVAPEGNKPGCGLAVSALMHSRRGQEPRGRLRLYQLADDGARAERRLGDPRLRPAFPSLDDDL